MAQPREQLPSQSLDRASGSMEQAAAGTRAGSDAELFADEEAFAKTRVSSPGKDAWRRFRHNWAALASLTLIGIMVFAAIFAPFLHTIDPNAFDFAAFH